MKDKEHILPAAMVPMTIRAIVTTASGRGMAIKAAGGAYSLRNRSSGNCVHVTGWRNAGGGNIQQWLCAATAKQAFRFVK